MRRLFAAMSCALFAMVLAGCGGGDHHHDFFVSGPGMVGIDDGAAGTAPLLTVTYTVPPSSTRTTVSILSDPGSDGDIEFDPVSSLFTVTSPASPVFFGIDSGSAHKPEFRSFLTFPLDGATGQGVVPDNAVIVSADLEVFVDEVRFAGIVPTFLDVVQYPFRSLAAPDFNAVPLDFRTLNFLSGDPGNFVRIDVTPLMTTAQAVPGLLDFQVRFSVDTTAPAAPSGAPAASAARTTVAPPRPFAGAMARDVKPLTPAQLGSRHR